MDRTYGDISIPISGPLRIDTDKHIVKIHRDIIDLSTTEYKLLLYMIDNEDNVLSREINNQGLGI
ncbi:hypothetical protein [Clostridium sp.]|uniref:hypothetical protein n=1 Tax=Clostridium sp. TaxID=1506 RepID=UPI001A57A98F|nr:hypothetical protein [Clostridium sp.]MBK5242697.1 response regulator transcription factor [Clostridium sp.]